MYFKEGPDIYSIKMNVKRKCCVPNCADKFSRRFYLPTKRERREIWIERIGSKHLFRVPESNILNYVICANHFDKMCFDAGGKLLNNSLPTINVQGFTDIPTRENCFMLRESTTGYIVPKKLKPLEVLPPRDASTILGGTPVASVIVPSRVYAKRRQLFSEPLGVTCRRDNSKDMQEHRDDTIIDQVLCASIKVECLSEAAASPITKEKTIPDVSLSNTIPSDTASTAPKVFVRSTVPSNTVSITPNVFVTNTVPSNTVSILPNVFVTNPNASNTVCTAPKEGIRVSQFVPSSTPQISTYKDVPKAKNDGSDLTAPTDSVDDTHSDIISNVGESLSDNENLQEYNCRTCLTTVEKQCCTRITKHCALGKTVKEAIALLVPKMFSRLKDSDVVCKDCFGVLESCIKFITRCLEIEDRFEVNRKIIKHAVVEGEQTRAQNIVLPKVSEIVDKEHDYYHEKSDYGSKNFIPEDHSVINDFDENSIKIEPEDLYEPTLEYPLPSYGSSDYIEEASDINIKESVPSIHTIVEQESTCKTKVREKEFTCSSCSERFASKEVYERHLEIHPPYVCDLCGKTFLTEKFLNAHIITHNDSDSFMCEVCGKGYKDPTALRYHLKIHNHKSGKAYRCDKCLKVFKSKYLLLVHIKNVHDNFYMIQCNRCGLLCSSEAALKYHIRLLHRSIKLYKCSICDKEFLRREYLLRHITTHTGQGYGSDAHREIINFRHRGIQIINKNGELLPCKFCGKVIGDRRRLEHHLSMHVNRHKCRFCPRIFFAKCQRIEHELIHETKGSFFRCNICHIKYKTKEGLDKHVRLDIHRRQPRYACGICGQKFYKKSTLGQHRLTEHKQKNQDDEFVYGNLLENMEYILVNC